MKKLIWLHGCYLAVILFLLIKLATGGSEQSLPNDGRVLHDPKDLRGIDWKRFSSRKNFRYVKLQESNLSGANLKQANLARANLSGSSLKGAYIKGANLMNANFKGARQIEWMIVELDEGKFQYINN